MRSSSTTRRKANTSKAARSAVSARRARRRRREQTRRQFAVHAHRFGAVLTRWRPRSFRPGWLRLSLQPILPGFSGLQPAKLLSLGLLTLVVTLLYWFHDDETFFVYQENVRFAGATYLTPDELYEFCDVESWSVLWLDPELIRSQVMQHPYVADSRVSVRWPAEITVEIDEIEPIALWSTDQSDFWLLENGVALPVRAETDKPLVRLLDPMAEARAPTVGEGRRVRPPVMKTALRLADQMPSLREFWYNTSYGLNFAFPGSRTWIYWGDGLKFEEKWQAMQAAQEQILARDESRTFNVIAPSRPFFRHFADPPSQQ